VSDFENRLKKNSKPRFKWAEREKVTAFRLYDLDMPEWPFAVDWYGGFVHVMEYPRRKQVRDGSIDEARAEVVSLFESTESAPVEEPTAVAETDDEAEDDSLVLGSDFEAPEADE